MTLRNSRISDNEAGNDGGGIWIGTLDSAMRVNSRVSRNRAGNDGGGIWNSGSLALMNSWVVNNVATNDGDNFFDA